MGDGLKKGSFDELVAGIGADERKYLLAKLKKNKGSGITVLKPLQETADSASLETAFQNESILYKFIFVAAFDYGQKVKIRVV